MAILCCVAKTSLRGTPSKLVTIWNNRNYRHYPKQNICFGWFASITKQRVSVFQLNQNKQKSNWNSFIESLFRVFPVCFGLFQNSLFWLFWYFSENLGLFWFVSKQFCLFRLFWNRCETPKQTETNQNFMFLVSRNKPKHNQNRSCFGLFRFKPKFFVCLFVSRTPYLPLLFNCPPSDQGLGSPLHCWQVNTDLRASIEYIVL